MNTSRNSVAVDDVPLIHYTDERIYSLKDGPSHPRLLKITKRKGKPAGFWYTHDDSWLSTYYEAGRANGPPGPRKLWRYEFRVPADVYTHDPSTADPTKILTLGRDNLAAFIERYHRPEFILSSQNIVGNILEQEAWANKTYSGGTHYGFVMSKTAGLNYKGAKALRQTMKRKAGRAGKPLKENADRILEYYRQYVNAPNVKPALRNIALGDIMAYDWLRFWDSVGANLGGIEFMPDVVDITTVTLSSGETLDMSWMRFLEIGSGVIFRPLTYFGGANPVEAQITYTVAPRPVPNTTRRTTAAAE